MLQRRGFMVRTAQAESMFADIIINEKETVAYLFVNETHQDEASVESFLRTFKNAFILFVAPSIKWSIVQRLQSIHPSARVLFAEDIPKSIEIAVQFLRVVCSDKKNAVAAFCTEKERKTITDQTVLSIIQSFPIQPKLKEMEANLILDSVGSLQNLLTEDETELYSQIPLDRDVLHWINMWIHPASDDEE